MARRLLGQLRCKHRACCTRSTPQIAPLITPQSHLDKSGLGWRLFCYKKYKLLPRTALPLCNMHTASVTCLQGIPLVYGRHRVKGLQMVTHPAKQAWRKV